MSPQVVQVIAHFLYISHAFAACVMSPALQDKDLQNHQHPAIILRAEPLRYTSVKLNYRHRHGARLYDMWPWKLSIGGWLDTCTSGHGRRIRKQRTTCSSLFLFAVFVFFIYDHLFDHLLISSWSSFLFSLSQSAFSFENSTISQERKIVAPLSIFSPHNAL